MARKDDKTGRLQPVIDYPFAEDGLDIWYAMREWFGSYLAIYYTDDKQVSLCNLVSPHIPVPAVLLIFLHPRVTVWCMV